MTTAIPAIANPSPFRRVNASPVVIRLVLMTNSGRPAVTGANVSRQANGDAR